MQTFDARNFVRNSVVELATNIHRPPHGTLKPIKDIQQYGPVSNEITTD
jgi:hypothetical protein